MKMKLEHEKNVAVAVALVFINETLSAASAVHFFYFQEANISWFSKTIPLALEIILAIVALSLIELYTRVSSNLTEHLDPLSVSIIIGPWNSQLYTNSLFVREQWRGAIIVSWNCIALLVLSYHKGATKVNS